VALLTDWGFDDLRLERIEIRADVRNVASRRTAAGAGYRYEGVLRGAMAVGDERVDDVLYALVPGDRRPWHDGPASGRCCETPSLGWPRLTDGRLVVRPFAPDDAPAVQAACDDPDVAHWIFGLPTPYGLEDAEAFIADALHRLLLGERARMAVTDAVAGELLGSVSLDRFAHRQAAEIGYWVKREARRRGVALGAARLVVAWAFSELGIERLELLTYPGNEASQALADKLGFRRECLLRGFLPPEAGKSREGRVVPSDDGSLPHRDDQAQFVRLRTDSAPSD
jgi:RimJ/RimL family protein N-acetyltransferase